ncbi:hypothetical protein MMC13_000737 [Lambiella insularis]|nr:hypothetical protein [Lambiella insularis]
MTGNSCQSILPASKQDVHSRKIEQTWPLDLGLKSCESGKEPVGIRTPNGIVWGHGMDEFFAVQPSAKADEPGTPMYWSLSMIREVDAVKVDLMPQVIRDIAPKPRLKRPWPLLQLPESHEHGEWMGREDEGCKHCLCTYCLLQSEPPFEKNNGSRIIKRKHSPEHISDGGLPPKLEEFIPSCLLPDLLVVYDPDDCALGLPTHHDQQSPQDAQAKHQLALRTDTVRRAIRAEAQRGVAQSREIARARRREAREGAAGGMDAEFEGEGGMEDLMYPTVYARGRGKHTRASLLAEMEAACGDLEREIGELEGEADGLLGEMQAVVGGLSELRYGKLAVPVGGGEVREEVLEGLRGLREGCAGGGGRREGGMRLGS